MQVPNPAYPFSVWFNRQSLITPSFPGGGHFKNMTMTNYEHWQLEKYGDILQPPHVSPDGHCDATEDELRRQEEYHYSFIEGVRIYHRPENWKPDYSNCENITDYDGTILAPIKDPRKDYGRLWGKFKQMQKEQPKTDHTGQHCAINQEWWQTQVNKELK